MRAIIIACGRRQKCSHDCHLSRRW